MLHRQGWRDIPRQHDRPRSAADPPHPHAIAVTGVRLDQTGVDGKAFTADKSGVDAALQDGLEQPPQQIALAEAAMPILREGRVVGHCTVKP
jgi:hypothetical protein